MNREDLRNRVATILSNKVLKFHVEIQSVNLVDIKFTENFNDAVEKKQIAEQLVKQKDYERQQAEQEAKRTVVLAQADAQRQGLLRQTLTREIVELEWIKKWNGEMPQTMLGGNSAVMMPMPASK